MLLFLCFCFLSYQELIRWLLLLIIWCPVCEELVFPVKVFSSLQKGQILCSNHTGLMVNVFSCRECVLQSPLFLLPVLGTIQVSSPYPPAPGSSLCWSPAVSELSTVTFKDTLSWIIQCPFHVFMSCVSKLTASLLAEDQVSQVFFLFTASLHHRYK